MNKNNIVKKEYLTVRELADLLGISRIAVFNRIKKGQIKAEKIGRNFIIHRKDLNEIIPDNQDLTVDEKKRIDQGVDLVIKEYGEVLKMLGQE